MLAAEVVERDRQREHVTVVLKLPAERASQPRESPVERPQAKIPAFHVRGRNVRRDRHSDARDTDDGLNAAR